MTTDGRQAHELPHLVAEQVAALAKIDKDREAQFCAGFQGLVRLAHTEHQWDIKSAPQRETIVEQLARVEEAASTLKDQLDSLAPAARWS
jgi:hypothetical protein